MTNQTILKSSNGSRLGDSEEPHKDKMRPTFSSRGSTSPKKSQRKVNVTGSGVSPIRRTSKSPKLAKSDPGHSFRGLEVKANNGPTTNSAQKSTTKVEFDSSFLEYESLGERLKKTMYFANKLPSTTRPSFPLTMLAVNAFTSGHLAGSSQLEFLDMEMASEIGRNACVSPTALIMALVYLDRLSNNPSYLASVKPSELFVVALLVASKFIQDEGEDNCIYNDEWAASAKLETKEINRLEITFLDALDWKVNVSSDEFNFVLQRIEENLAADQGTSRGWFTYTELEKMSNSLVTWKLIWPTVYYYAVQVITAAAITYATVLTTILVPHIYFFSNDLLASTGSGYKLGVSWINSNTGHCFNFNATQSLMFSNYVFDEIEPDLSLDFDQIKLELRSDEKDINRTHHNKPYFYALNVNSYEKYSQPLESGPKYLSHLNRRSMVSGDVEHKSLQLQLQPSFQEQSSQSTSLTG